MAIIAIGILTFFIAYLLLRIVLTLFKHYEISQWPHIEGVVVESKALIETTDLGAWAYIFMVIDILPFFLWMFWLKDEDWGGISYRPGIKYEYNVKNEKFSNNRLNLLIGKELNFASDEFKGFISNYMVGKKIEVYYNPENPQESYLFRRFPVSFLVKSIILMSITGLISYILIHNMSGKF
jgi:hypothetical protein